MRRAARQEPPLPGAGAHLNEFGREPLDEPFFREWRRRRTGERRSLARAATLAEVLGLDLAALPPTVVVVGSKGKGTAAAFASAGLAAHGLRVGTVTSPALRANRERVRLDGVALEEDYAAMSDRLAAALRILPPSASGYLSPAGAYLVTGIDHLVRAGVDVLVVEEGMGGASDEVSLLRPRTVVLTPVFLEHGDVLGPDVTAVAADLLGVVGPSVSEVWSAAQGAPVGPLVGRRAGARLRTVDDAPWAVAATAHVPGLGAANAALGLAAGQSLAASAFGAVDRTPAVELAGRVRLPGRLSVHRVPGAPGRAWVVDGAISPEGVRTARRWTEEQLGPPGQVLACFPDGKDAAGCRAELGGVPATYVSLGEPHLTYAGHPPDLPLRPFADAVRGVGAGSGPVLCVGTMSFVSRMLGWLDVDTTRLW